MDSLPEQHINSLARDAQEDAYWKVSAVCVLRGKRLPEDVVAKNAGFDSVEDMYFRLRRWGLPGLTPSSSKPPRKPQVPASEGEVQELPPFANAATLERKSEGEMVVIPQPGGGVARFPKVDLARAYVAALDRTLGRSDTDHPLCQVARRSPDPEWSGSFYAGPEVVPDPPSDLSE